jgi:Ca2+-binding RTX toxin-like protein
MAGGLGNDTYVVDNAGDTVSEGAGAGTDRVLASVSYSLADPDVENLTLTGVAAINGTGNAAANTIVGNGAANTLLGLAGNDSISAGAGNDVVQGGTGSDTIRGGTGNDVLRAVDNVFFVNDGAEDRFVFDTALNAVTNVDLIDKANFTQGGLEGVDDEIHLENGIFTALLSVGGTNLGQLGAGYYFEGASSGGGQFDAVGIYNVVGTGQLFYNPTFGVAGDSVLFAVVNPAGIAGGPAVLSAEEFTLV